MKTIESITALKELMTLQMDLNLERQRQLHSRQFGVSEPQELRGLKMDMARMELNMDRAELELKDLQRK
jgi:hypothetical protein